MSVPRPSDGSPLRWHHQANRTSPGSGRFLAGYRQPFSTIAAFHVSPAARTSSCERNTSERCKSPRRDSDPPRRARALCQGRRRSRARSAGPRPRTMVTGRPDGGDALEVLRRAVADLQREVAELRRAQTEATHPPASLLTQIQVCRRLGVCVQTWRNWRDRGLTPLPVMMTGRPRWLAAEIEAFERGRRVPDPGRRTFFGSVERRRR